MSSIGAALGAAFVSTARAEASRINGAKSRGPKTAEGKARSSRNALKHGFRAEKFTVVGDEDEADYEAHEQALLAELAPDGALQTLLAERIARAAWRLARADCIEAQLFDLHAGTDGDLGLALIRDGHGTRAFDTLLRYRGAAQAELWRALRTLKALQAEQAQLRASAPGPAPALVFEPRRAGPALERAPAQRAANPTRVKIRSNPRAAILLNPRRRRPQPSPQCPPVGPRARPNEPAPAPTVRFQPNEPEPAARAARPSAGQPIAAIKGLAAALP